MRHFSFLLFAGIILLSACGPKVSTSILKSSPTLDYREEVRIFVIHETEPSSAEVLGYIRVGDSGFSTNCGWEIVTEKAKLEARKIGGNAIKITDHKRPDFMSTCHRISAKILKVNSFDEVAESETVDSVLLNADYALLHIYRHGGTGFLVSYDLQLGDTVIARVQSNSKLTVKIRKEGENVLWARTEARAEVPVNIELGREYYLRCGIGIGAFVGRPQLDLVDNQTGMVEFQSIIQKRSKKDMLIMKDGREVEGIIKSEDEEQIYITIFSKGVEVDTSVPKDQVESINRRDSF